MILSFCSIAAICFFPSSLKYPIYLRRAIFDPAKT